MHLRNDSLIGMDARVCKDDDRTICRIFELPVSPCREGARPDIPSLCLEVLAYLAYEATASAMDVALLVR